MTTWRANVHQINIILIVQQLWYMIAMDALHCYVLSISVSSGNTYYSKCARFCLRFIVRKSDASRVRFQRRLVFRSSFAEECLRYDSSPVTATCNAKPLQLVDFCCCAQVEFGCTFRNACSSLQPPLHSVTPLQQLAAQPFFRAWRIARAYFFVNPTDRRTRRASCEFPQAFLAQIAASCSGSCRTVKNFKRCVAVTEKIAQCNSAFTVLCNTAQENIS